MAEGLFDDGSVIRRVNSEGIILAGGGRALLLQLAHPQVAQGVAEHSNFKEDPLSRLNGTLEFTYTVVFGARIEAERISEIVRIIHQKVIGPGYTASDPELLCWVNATLIETALGIYECVFSPLDPHEVETYYE